MDRTVSTLALQNVVRYWSQRQFPRFWHVEPRLSSAQEILINGRNMRELFDLAHPKPPAESTALLAEHPGNALARIERLLGLEEPDFDGGRVALLVCPGCLEAGCGALSVKVRHTEDAVTWAEAGWQDGTRDDEAVSPVPGPQAITFARKQYEAVLITARDLWRERAARAHDHSALDLVSYPVLAVDDEGGVHCFDSREALEGMGELFVHGEFTLIVDARGFEYSYAEGDLQYIELRSVKLFDALELRQIVEDRMAYLRTRAALRLASGSSPGSDKLVNNDFSEAFRLARKYELR